MAFKLIAIVEERHLGAGTLRGDSSGAEFHDGEGSSSAKRTGDVGCLSVMSSRCEAAVRGDARRG